jgi:hypothetical protein
MAVVTECAKMDDDLKQARELLSLAACEVEEGRDDTKIAENEQDEEVGRFESVKNNAVLTLCTFCLQALKGLENDIKELIDQTSVAQFQKETLESLRRELAGGQEIVRVAYREPFIYLIVAF